MKSPLQLTNIIFSISWDFKETNTYFGNRARDNYFLDFGFF